MQEIDVQTLAKQRRGSSPPLVLDVREPWEIGIAALNDSRHIPMRQIPERVDELPRDAPIVVLCHHGVRSREVTRFLHQAGFDQAVNLAGGIDAWSRVVDPGMPRY